MLEIVSLYDYESKSLKLLRIKCLRYHVSKNVFVLNASVSETTNPKLDKKKETNKTNPSNSSPKEMVTNSDEDIGQECENNTRGLLN